MVEETGNPISSSSSYRSSTSEVSSLGNTGLDVSSCGNIPLVDSLFFPQEENAPPKAALSCSSRCSGAHHILSIRQPAPAPHLYALRSFLGWNIPRFCDVPQGWLPPGWLPGSGGSQSQD